MISLLEKIKYINKLKKEKNIFIILFIEWPKELVLHLNRRYLLDQRNFV